MIKIEFPNITTGDHSFKVNPIFVEGKAIKITYEILKEIGCVHIDNAKVGEDRVALFQVGVLQYGYSTLSGLRLWDEVSDKYFDDAIALKSLHELQIQYFGITFKQLNICNQATEPCRSGLTM